MFEPARVGITGYSINKAWRFVSQGRAVLPANVTAGRLKVTRVGRRTIVSAESLRKLIEGGA